MNKDWKWWVGYDEEAYTTQCATRSEAVQIAREEYGGAWIVEATNPPEIKLSWFFDAEQFLDQAEDQAWDSYANHDSPEALFELTEEQLGELQTTVRNAISQWEAERGLKFTSWQFGQMCPPEYIRGEVET